MPMPGLPESHQSNTAKVSPFQLNRKSAPTAPMCKAIINSVVIQLMGCAKVLSRGNRLMVLNLAHIRILNLLPAPVGHSESFVNLGKSDYYRKVFQTSKSMVRNPLDALVSQPHPRELLNHLEDRNLALQSR